jgi:X-Pro dipeptidyl-peptidase
MLSMTQKLGLFVKTIKKDEPTSYEDYPNPNAKPVQLYIGTGVPERSDLTTTPNKQEVIETLIDNYSFSGTSLAKAEITDHGLIYLSQTLTQDIHIFGTTNVTTKLASSKPAVNLSIWLVSLPWDEGKNSKITDNIITRGWGDPQNHQSLRESEPLTPGKSYEVSFNLMPDDQIIAKGQQIGLMIFSSDKEFTL